MARGYQQLQNTQDLGRPRNRPQQPSQNQIPDIKVSVPNPARPPPRRRRNKQNKKQNGANSTKSSIQSFQQELLETVRQTLPTLVTHEVQRIASLQGNNNGSNNTPQFGSIDSIFSSLRSAQ
eukprot:TRINITY_DN1330_c0_g1_i2.p1 TRINITY_DN1330_c0_g1~~TRINITY_DN1330_c0_g1_i2.p1  ORF type:complete len:122 (+),score=13.73 TRINITY_DN1330_c0_g1_i2:521-886(+)